MKRVLGLLGWLGVVLVLAAVAVRFVKPEMVEVYQGLAIAGLVVTLLYTLSQWRDIGRSMSGKGARYGSMALGSVVLMLGILIAINYIGSRQTKRWDLTGGQQFSLSDQSKKIASELKQPLAFRIYYQTGAIGQAHDKLDGYTLASAKITVEYIDAEKNPARAQQDGVQQYGTVIMEYAGRTERITTLEEQDVTNAIIKLVEGKVKKAYFIQGHGERDPISQDRMGYTQVAARLKNDNYEVAKSALAQDGKLPDDATIVIIAGPQTDYLPQEIDAITTYLAAGGKLLMMIDVQAKPDAAPLANLTALAKAWGIAIGSDLILDASGMGRAFGAGPEVPVAMAYPSHPITQGFGNTMTAYRLARSAAPIDGGTNGHIAQRVVESSTRSWAEADIKSLAKGGGPVALNLAHGDKPGPVAIASAVAAAATNAPASTDPKAPKPETRIVVIGDSDFIGNDLISFQGNGDLFLNMVNWTAQQENLIAIGPKDPQDRRITLTEAQRQGIFWLAIFIIPGIFLAAGIFTWYKRR
ncbi:MAG: Gldg family protein [Acidobacteriota bacterium]